MKNLMKVSALLSAALLAGPVAAASFNFDYTFDGTSITQNLGSDTAAGTNLMVGDDYTATVSAAGDDFFRVDADLIGSVFPMTFGVIESNNRTANITTTLFLDGVQVQQSTLNGAVQSFVHIGTQTVDLLLGTEFDQMVVDWDFLAISNPGDTTISATTDFFTSFGVDDAPFFRSDNISYNQGMAPIPLPAGLPLLGAGLLGLGLLGRRRKS